MKKLLLLSCFIFTIGAFSQSTHIIDFEPSGTGADWLWTVSENADNPPLEFVANPNNSGINASAMAAKFTARAAGNPWALCFTDDNEQFTFDATNAIVKIMVHKPRISNVGIKFEGFSSPVEILIPNTLINQWEEITFDFSGVIGNTYSKLIIIPDFATRTEDQIVYFDNIQVPEGEQTGPLPEPTTVPPIPSHAPEDVISIYSDEYNNVSGTNFNPYWQQTTIVTVNYNVAGNNTIKYENLNYQGTQLVNLDVSLYEFFHLDFWTPNSTGLSFYLISPGPVEKAYPLTITHENWVSVDIPLSHFDPPVNLGNVFQFKVVGNGVVYFDNWYFWKNPTASPADATLSDLKVDDTTVPGFTPTMLNYNVALPFGTTEVPVVTATTTNPAATHVVNATPSLPGTTSVVVTSEDGSTTLTYNVHFSIQSPEPATAPPTPTHAAEDVVSIYSDEYVDEPGTNFDPFWGQQTIVTIDYLIAGQNTIRYQNLNFQGTELVNLDVSGYDYYHLDFWTANSTSLEFFMISPGPMEKGFVLDITPETWVSVDIPLDYFDPPVNLSDLFQFKIEGDGDVWFANWYFWKNPAGPGSDATLSDLQVDGETVEGFLPAVLNYTVELPEGTTEVPVVTATTSDPEASHVVIPAQELPGTTEVVVTSSNGSVVKTYAVEFTLEGAIPGSEYCETEVWHFGNPANESSAIYLTITNSGTNTMFVEIESANDDPVDLLEITGGSGATISDENTTVPGKISRTLTWASDPPETVLMNVLWSKESFLGNWMLLEGDISVPFAAYCEPYAPKPYLALDIQDNFEDDGYATVENWQFQDAATFTDLPVTIDPIDPENHVADFSRSGTYEYTNARVILDHRMDLTSRRRFEMKVFFPSSNNYQGALTPTAAIRLQNSSLGANAYLTQTEVVKTVTQFDQWVTLVFSFIAAADSVNYDQIVVQLGGEGHFVPGQFYFDDIRLLPASNAVEANFSATPLSGYAPLTVAFSDLSTGVPTTWKWDFDNDGIIDSELKNPVHIYEEPGVYSVWLRVQNPFTGTDEMTKQNYITVTELVLPDYTYTDFDDQINVELSGWPNMPTAEPNPDPAGINLSPNVGKWQRSSEPYANIYTLLDATLDFSGSSMFLLKAIAPVACEVVFKLENSINPAITTQQSASIETPGQWEQLIFDFPGAASDLYDKMIIFFDFESTDDNIFYFDELMGPPPTGISLYKPLLAADVQDNFEDDGFATIPAWYLQDPILVPLVVVDDPENAENHVAEYIRSGTFEFTNTQFILDHRMDLSERNQFEMKVYFPSSNNYTGALLPRAEIKLQNSLLEALAYTTQSVFWHTVDVFDEWVTYQFDFSPVADSVNYDQVVVQFGGEGHLEPGLFYFDDFRLLDIPIEQVVQINQGWSGISSFVVPDDPTLEDLLGSLEGMVIMYGDDGEFIPSQGINTLVNWNPAKGYAIKLTDNDELVFEGTETADATLTLEPGWTIVPVISACPVEVESLFGQYNQIIFVKEVADVDVYWPEKEINTLQNLMPGKAYFFLTNAAVTFTFPDCGSE